MDRNMERANLVLAIQILAGKREVALRRAMQGAAMDYSILDRLDAAQAALVIFDAVHREVITAIKAERAEAAERLDRYG